MADKKTTAPREVTVREEPIELCQFLKFGGLAATGGEAREIVLRFLAAMVGKDDRDHVLELVARGRINSPHR